MGKLVESHLKVKKKSNKNKDDTKGSDDKSEPDGGANLEKLDTMDLRELIKLSIQKHDNVSRKIDNLANDLRSENKKVREELNALSGTVNEHSEAIEFTNRRIDDISSDFVAERSKLTNSLKTVNENGQNLSKTVKRVQEDIKANKSRLTACELQVNELQETTKNKSTNVDEEEFPVSKTIVLQNVLYTEPENIMKVARGVIHKCLGLSNVGIVKAKRISVRADGTGLVKVLVKSEDDLRDVLRNKMKIRDSRNPDVSKIWIKQSKTKQQLIAEQNSNTLLKECKLDGVLRMLPSGRLVRRSERISNHDKNPNYRSSTPRNFNNRGGRSYTSHTFTNSARKRSTHSTTGQGLADLMSPGSDINSSINTSRNTNRRSGPIAGSENPSDERVAQQMEREKRKSTSDV